MALRNYQAATTLRKLYRTRDLSSLDPDERESLLGIALLIPALILIFGVIIWPLFYNVYLSVHEVPLSPGESAEFVGTAHFTDTLEDDRFWTGLQSSVIYTAFSAFFATTVGLGVSLLFRRQFRGIRIARAINLLPYIMPVIAAAFVWRFMGNATYGIGTYTLVELDILEYGTDLINDRTYALWSLIVFDTWRYYPFAFLMVYARVQSIPQEMYEAAKIDGAGWFARFKDITLPELKFVLAAVVLLRVIWNFNAFSQVWLFTRAVEVLPVYAFITAFTQWDLGRGAAISFILFGFQMTFVIVYLKWAMDW